MTLAIDKKKEKKYYTTHEVASLLGVTTATVIRWNKDGKIYAYKTLGGHRRISHDEVNKLIDKFVGGEK